MKFDDLDARMRVFEELNDHKVWPGIFAVARLDGRGFSRLTKETHAFEAPFDERFRDHMAVTVRHLMSCGFRVIYGYTQSDEISLLFHRDEEAFERKLRKWNSILAGEASSAFSLSLNAAGCFDCRISQLPSEELVVEYFRWRQEDASRNALNAYCYWTLRKEGKSVGDATSALLSLGLAAKNEMLFQRGINYDKVPVWQRRGFGFFWQNYQKPGVNLKTRKAVSATRRAIHQEMNLPMKSAYEDFLHDRLVEAKTRTVSG